MNTPSARALEASIRGRPYTAVPALVGAAGAAGDGIDGAIRSIGACRALEAALGLTVDERTETARRLLSCAIWIQGHAQYIHFVKAPEYLGYADAGAFAQAEPAAAARGLALSRLGTDLAESLAYDVAGPCLPALGHPSRPSAHSSLAALRPRLQDALDAAVDTVRWVSGFDIPISVLDVPLLTLDDPAQGGAAAHYPVDGGRGVLASNGLGFPLGDFESFVTRPRARAADPTRAVLRGAKAILTGPLARYTLRGRALHPTARAAASRAGLDARIEHNPHRSTLIRAVELVHALEEAINLVDALEQCPAPGPRHGPMPSLMPASMPGHGVAAVEGPAGLCYQRYDLTAYGTVSAARLVGPDELNRTVVALDQRRASRSAKQEGKQR